MEKKNKKTKKVCPEYKQINPKTGRCIRIPKQKTQKVCSKDKRFNPKTRRCKKIKVILNPVTGRCIKLNTVN